MGRYTDQLRKRLRNPLQPATVAALRSGVEKRYAKGRFDGGCNREACQRPIAGANHYNTSTQAYYCGDCAKSLNAFSARTDGVIICKAVSDPNDRPAYPYMQLPEGNAA